MKRILFTVLASSISSPFHDEKEKLRTTYKFQHGGERLEEFGRIKNCVPVWLQQNRRKIYSMAANTEIEEITIVVHTHSPRAAHTESR